MTRPSTTRTRDRRRARASPATTRRRWRPLAGTPFYVYDLDVVERRLAALRAVLPPGSRWPTRPRRTRRWPWSPSSARLGVGADIASGGELELGRAGRHRSRVGSSSRGPARPTRSSGGRRGRGPRDHRRVAGRAGRLERVAAELRPAGADPAALGRRRSAAATRASGSSATPAPASSGWAQTTSRAAAQAAAAVSSHLELLGVHAFGASNLRDADALVEHVDDTVAVRGRRDRRGRAFRCGSSTPAAASASRTTTPTTPLDLDRLGAGPASRRLSAGRRIRDSRSPGAARAGPLPRRAGGRLRHARHRREAARRPDGRDRRRRHPPRPAAGARPAAAPARPPGAAAAQATASGRRRRASPPSPGPLCTGLDILSPDAPVGAVRPGDLLAVLDVGRLRLHRVDAALPVADDARRARAPRRPGGRGAAAHRAAPLPGPAATARLVGGGGSSAGPHQGGAAG